MKQKNKNLTSEVCDRVVRLAWEDRTSFEYIEEKFGLTESEVIEVMRSQLKNNSFRRWRARVTGRLTKHRKLFNQRLT